AACYPLSLHDALPIFFAALADGVSRITHYAPGQDCQSTLSCLQQLGVVISRSDALDRATGATIPVVQVVGRGVGGLQAPTSPLRSEEHTSELQSRENL